MNLQQRNRDKVPEKNMHFACSLHGEIASDDESLSSTAVLLICYFPDNQF